MHRADIRGCLADRLLHLPWWTAPDWRRFLGLLHMSMHPLDDWVPTKWLVTLIPEQTLAPCYISRICSLSFMDHIVSCCNLCLHHVLITTTTICTKAQLQYISSNASIYIHLLVSALIRYCITLVSVIYTTVSKNKDMLHYNVPHWRLWSAHSYM